MQETILRGATILVLSRRLNACQWFAKEFGPDGHGNSITFIGKTWTSLVSDASVSQKSQLDVTMFKSQIMAVAKADM